VEFRETGIGSQIPKRKRKKNFLHENMSDTFPGSDLDEWCAFFNVNELKEELREMGAVTVNDIWFIYDDIELMNKIKSVVSTKPLIFKRFENAKIRTDIFQELLSNINTLKTVKETKKNVTSVSFSADGTRIVSGSDDGSIKVWDSVIGELINTLSGHSSQVKSVSINADGTRIVSGSGDGIKLWDSVTLLV
jgi:WD40 repeat protein